MKLLALIVMFAGPLLHGLTGATDPQAILFAPIIAIATLPVGRSRDLGGSLRMAAVFLAVGALCLALWWLGGQAGPQAIPRWLPLAVTAAGALLAILPGFLRR